MRYFLLFLMLMPSCAIAYDERDAAWAFGKCLGDKSQDHYFANGGLLVQECQPEYQIFMSYCSEVAGEENCAIIVAKSVYAALKQGKRP